MGNVENNEEHVFKNLEFQNKSTGYPDVVLEEYEYECPVPDCKNRVKDMINKNGFYMCGIPKHCCSSCTDQGWKHLSGHGGSPYTWKEEPTDNV